MDIEQVEIFVQAAHGGGLSEAARRLGITPARASRGLAALERSLSVALAHRTTRRLTLTAEGEAFLPRAEALLEAAQAARDAVAGVERVEGLLRVGAPLPLARRVVSPALPALLAAHPGLRVDLQIADAYVDIVGAGLDVALRVGRLEDSSLVSRRLAPSPIVLCAAPSYLQRRGRPETVADLSAHDCLVRAGVDHWIFEGPSGPEAARVVGRMLSNSHVPLRQACLGGAGLALYAHWDAAEDIEAGRLEIVTLDRPLRVGQSIWALYPTRRLVPQKVRIFIEAMAAALGALQ